VTFSPLHWPFLPLFKFPPFAAVPTFFFWDCGGKQKHCSCPWPYCSGLRVPAPCPQAVLLKLAVVFFLQQRQCPFCFVPPSGKYSFFVCPSFREVLISLRPAFFDPACAVVFSDFRGMLNPTLFSWAFHSQSGFDSFFSSYPSPFFSPAGSLLLFPFSSTACWPYPPFFFIVILRRTAPNPHFFALSPRIRSFAYGIDFASFTVIRCFFYRLRCGFQPFG